jgi:DHA1 family bicyclomycin/chloramphenicol resistance-like MFS transporter
MTTALLLALSFIIFLAEAEIDIVVPSFPGLMTFYSISVAKVELVLTLNLIAHGLSGLWIGWLADHYGKRHILLGGLLIFLLGSGMTLIVKNFYWLLLGRILQGAGMAAPVIVGYIIAIENTEGHKREEIVAILNGVISISLAITPALGALIAHMAGWHASFQLLFILGIGALILAFYMIPADTTPNKAMKEERLFDAYWRILKDRRQFDLIASTLLLPAGWFAFIGLGPILYVNQLGTSLMGYGFHQGIIALGYGIMSLCAYALIERIGRWPVIWASFAGIVFASIGLILGFFFNLFSPWYVTSFILLGSISSVFIVNKTHLLAVTHKIEDGSKVSALITFGRWLLTGLVLGISSLLYVINPTLSLLVVALTWITALAYLVFLFKETHNFWHNFVTPHTGTDTVLH